MQLKSKSQSLTKLRSLLDPRRRVLSSWKLTAWRSTSQEQDLRQTLKLVRKIKKKVNIDKPPTLQVKIVPSFQKVTIKSTMYIQYSYDDMTIQEEELVKATKKRKRLDVSDAEKINSEKLTSNIAHVNNI